MAVITGLNMAVNGENTNRMFQITTSNELRRYSASNTQSGAGRRCGIDEWKGMYLGYGSTPAVFPGDFFTFAGSVDGTNGWVSATNGAYCEQIDIVGNIEEQQYLQYAVHFSRSGSITPGAAEYSDDTLPAPPCTNSLTVNRGSVDEDDVRFYHLVMRCPGRKYNSSSTDGGYQRKRGVFDAFLEYHRYFSNPTTLPALERDYAMRLNTTTVPEFWDLAWMKAAKIEAIVNTETQENMGAKIFMEFNGHNGTATGYCKTPAAVEKWPFTT